MTTLILITGAIIVALLAARPRQTVAARVDREIDRQLAELAARGIVPDGNIWKELGQ